MSSRQLKAAQAAHTTQTSERLQETKLTRDKLTKEVVCIDDDIEVLCLSQRGRHLTSLASHLPMAAQSFWACSSSEGKLGYSGTVTYVRKAWSPVAALAECIGDRDDEFWAEGR